MYQKPNLRFGTFFLFTNQHKFAIVNSAKTFWEKRDAMKKPNLCLRILCGVLDAVIVMIPIQFVMMGIFKVSVGQAELLYKFLFAVYGTLMTEYFAGTAGKYLGKLAVRDISGSKAPILFVGLRELVKAMYLIPVIGWCTGLISVVMMIVRKDGRGLHDFAGNTRVVYQWQVKEAEHAGE